jgi:murein DD-endopeptidase MepM/ murein hydrolase activator NlpD
VEWLVTRGTPAWSAEQVYAPFIIAGPATWSNSWGDPRYGPGSLIRSHHGQDVLCELGAPVLAAAVGEVHFDVGILGGLSATIDRPEGGALYYAHLSSWNEDLDEGDLVVPGQVIGYCGQTGNASVPHVHFGSIAPDGSAVDPMAFLVGSLRSAEFRFSSLHRSFGPSSSSSALFSKRTYWMNPLALARLGRRPPDVALIGAGEPGSLLRPAPASGRTTAAGALASLIAAFIALTIIAWRGRAGPARPGRECEGD